MSPFEQLQLDIAGRLESLEFFADVPVIVFRPREKKTATVIQTQIDKTLTGLIKKNGKAGVAVTVLMPVGDVPDADVPGPEFVPTCTIRCQEIPLVNMGAEGTGKSAETVALEVSQALHHFETGWQSLYCPNEALTPQGAADATDRRVTYDVNIATTLPLEPPVKLPRPAINGPASAVALSSLDAEAEIWWTADGSFPRPDAPDATLYDEPFAVDPGTFIRAAAYKDGVHGSDVAAKTVN